MVLINVNKLHDDAVIPTRGSAGAAGYDLYSVEDVTIAPGARTMIDTGIAMEMLNAEEFPYYARIAPRSGLAVKHGIDTLAGVVDSDYRDSIKVVLINHGCEDFVVKKGDRVAQLVFEMVVRASFFEAELSSTDRGFGGFGSTGK